MNTCRLPIKIRFVVLLVILSWSLMGIASAQKITRVVLGNGLRVVVKEDHSIPVTALNAQVHVGGRDETDKTTGFSHFLEHVIFRQGEEGKPTASRRRIFSLGGLMGGATGYDKTQYGIVIAGRHFNEALDILAECLMKATFSSEDIESEKKIIADEFRKKRQDINRLSFAESTRAVFLGQPYGHEPIGTLPAINQVKPKDLYDWYKTFYAPNNMALAIVGDVRTEEVINKVKEKFGVYKANEDLPRKPSIENAFSGYLLRTQKANFKDRGSCNVGFIIPGFKHPDRYALELVHTILGGGSGRRLNWRLVEQEKLASKIVPWYECFADQGLMLFTILPRNIKDIYQIPSRALDEIIKLTKNGITQDELSTAKEILQRKFIFENEDLNEQAVALARGETLGGVKYAASYLENINNVSLEDVRRVLAIYLCKENLKIVYLIPEDMEDVTPAESKKTENLADSLKLGSLNPGKLDFTKVLYDARECHQIRSGELEISKPGEKAAITEKLSNGLTLVVSERHNLPIVSLSLQIKAGPRYSGKPGLAKAVSQMLLEGTRQWSKEEILKKHDELGGKFQTDINREVVMLNTTYLSKDFKSGLELLAEMVTQPLLDPQGLHNVRSLLASEAQRKSDEINSLAKTLVLRSIFPNQPYGYPIEGTIESIKSIDREDVIKFYRDFYGPKNTVLVVVGDVDYAQVKELALRLFAAWKNPAFDKEKNTVKTHKGGTITKSIKKEQAQLALGVPFRSPLKEDYAKKHFLSFVISQRNFFELVYNQAISYGTGSYVEPLYEAPILYAYASTDKKNLDRARGSTIKNIAELIKGDVKESEINDFKQNFIGLYSLFNIKSLFLAITLGYYETLGKSHYYPNNLFKEIEALNGKSLSAYARKDLAFDQLTTVLVGSIEQE